MLIRKLYFTIYLHEEMANIGKRTLLRDVNPHLICLLCRGYLIDATTVVECLHSFCRSCILKYLSTAAHCPSCKHAINKAKPNIKADKTLQEIVYKLVPGLYHKEMLKRKEFYRKHPEHVISATPEQRGEDVSGRLIFNPEDVVSLSLEYLPPGADPLTILSTNDIDTNNLSNTNTVNNNNSNYNNNIANSRRYLQCPALVTVAHLKKFIAMKYSVDLTRYTIEICHRRATLPENWTLMDVAYIYAWKRIAPMRFFYRVAQEEQKLEAPVHQRPSTPGLGARDCLPPNEARNDSNLENPINYLETSKVETKLTSDSIETMSTKDLNKIDSYEVISPTDYKQKTKIEKNELKMTMTTISATSSLTTTTTTNATGMPTTSPSSGANASFSPTCNDSNKQIKSPIKILKNSEGKYEVLKSPLAATLTDLKNPKSNECPTNPEFSVVNSNGVKITLKQCSPPQNSSAKKPKVISNVLLRCGKMEKNISQPSGLMIQQMQKQQQQDKDKLITISPMSGKQEKHRRKVTFVDQSPTSEKVSPTTSITMPKTALKKPAEQQDKKQFLQGFQLTAKEPSDDGKLKSPVQDNSVVSTIKSFQKSNAIPKIEEFSNKDIDNINKKNNIENTGSNANNSTTTTNMLTKCFTGVSANLQTYTPKTDDVDGQACNSKTSPNCMNIASGNYAAKTDVYTFSSDPPIVPVGAVKRKCPPGVPIADLKRRKTSQVMQKQETNKRQNVSSYNSIVSKLPHTSSSEHVVPINKTINMIGDHDAGSSRVASVNTKTSTGPLLSNDTRDLLVDGYGLNIPASLSITLTSPKSPGSSGQFVEPNDSNDNRKPVLGKVNPSITLNDRSVDPRVLKALKTGQIRMPTTSSKAKSTAIVTTTAAVATKQTVTTDRREAVNQQRTTPTTYNTKRKKEHESSKDILDLSGGNKKMDIHPLRIPQPVTKLNKTNKVTSRNNMQSEGISNQGQVVTLMGGHKYYRAPPGSLTPAAHRVNDCPLPSPSRTPVYAPSFGSINRSNSDLSSVFPSLPSLYALHQAPNLQQFQIDATRLRLSSRSAAEGGATTAIGNSDNANSNIGVIPGKSHLAAQCAPVKPARSSVAPLAVPINKQQLTEKSTNISINRTVPVDPNKPSAFCNDIFGSTDETSCAQKRYSLNVESTNKFLSKSECIKNNDQVTNDIATDSNAESRNKTVNNSMQQQEQQHREATSPNIVSSTASPSPPPVNGGINVTNERSANNDNGIVNNNDSNGVNNTMPRTEVITSDQTKSTSSEMTCNKSPDSPDSSSITVDNSETSKSLTLTDRKMSTNAQSSDSTKAVESAINPDNSTVDDSTTIDDKNKLTNKSEASEIAKQLTSVQKKLLAVFPSTEWNPKVAEHLGNFLISLNATINEGFTEGSKMEKTDQKTSNDDNENR
ncbi:probable serine/threonine-protein kinase ndrD isoform X2 [Solenopsis invicta]|uniref:probable serine/threonine-protein kinase ndrD isoform X2 n=1 Tax=Solenopsis invicta TaxID=13686 RepID=UPI00193C9B4F|nr:probable serine/threonine-protein kinase ndrD isoform X2 [Solenopsis invicta]